MDTKNLTINENWKFHLGDCEPAWYKGFDDGGWREVRLPHDWSVELPFDRANSSGTGYVSGGIGWYRGRFTLPEKWRGKCVRLVFDGVYKNSQVWCNSYYLGRRPNGYVTFSYDITPFARFGEENEVSVKVVHTDLADSRWFTGSGITRSVHLTVQEPVHPAQDGVFFEAKEISFEQGKAVQAQVQVTLELVNALEKPAGIGAAADQGCCTDGAGAAKEENGCENNFGHVGEEVKDCAGGTVYTKVRAQLLDADGRVALELSGETAVEPEKQVLARQTVHSPAQTEGVGAVLCLTGTLANPRLWSVEHPELYRLRVFLSPKGQPEYQVFEESVGVRTFRFDPDLGFFLNEENRKIKGVCVHHDGGCLGAAMTTEVWQRRLSILKECGCNAIRCSHNPHMPELYALCDRMGFLMMDEAFDEWENPKNKWSTGHNVYPPRHQGYYEEFPQWHEADLKAMVRRDRNHPSVILWSIGNEIDYPNDPYCHPSFAAMTGNNDADKPAAERQYNPDKPNAERLSVLAARLSGMVRQEDKSRPVTLAAAFPELSADLGFLDSLDVAGYNYKEHLYEADHRRFPKLPILGSENSHDYAAWKAVRDHDYISGKFLWTGVDFLGEAHGWPVRGSLAGLLTLAGDKKPEFYQTASFWKDSPVLHLSTKPAPEEGQPPRWTPLKDCWNYEAGQAVTAVVMSNAPEVALFLNGREVGRQKGCGEDGMFTFSVAYEPGELKAVSYGGTKDAEGRTADSCGEKEAGNILQTVSLYTSGPAESLRASLWQAEELLIGKSQKDAGRENGYLFQISAELLDASGHRCTADDRRVTVEVTGGGELAGLENGNLSDDSPYPANHRKTWLGRLTAYVRRTGPEKIAVHLRADGVEEETMYI